jgi:hypothetical protein
MAAAGPAVSGAVADDASAPARESRIVADIAYLIGVAQDGSLDGDSWEAYSRL